MINERKPTVPIWSLNIGDNFTMNGVNVIGELLSCHENSDVHVRLTKGTKVEKLWWSRDSLVVPIARSEIYVEEVVGESKTIKVKEPETNKIINIVGKDKYGSRIGKHPANINSVISYTPQSVFQIAEKVSSIEKSKIDGLQICKDLQYMVKKKIGVGPFLKVENNMYSL